MYLIVKDISYFIRWVVCYFTIEQHPIFANEAIQWVLAQILSIYVILRIICYAITGVFASKLQARTSTEKSIIYFFIYLIVAIIVYRILQKLTQLQILPL